MKRKKGTKLTPCEEKALVHLQAEQIKEKEAKAKQRAKKRKLGGAVGGAVDGQRIAALAGQNIPFQPQPYSGLKNFRPFYPIENPLPSRNEWNQLIPAAAQTAQFMIMNHLMQRNGIKKDTKRTTTPTTQTFTPPPPRDSEFAEMDIEIMPDVGPPQLSFKDAPTGPNALRNYGINQVENSIDKLNKLAQKERAIQLLRKNTQRGYFKRWKALPPRSILSDSDVDALASFVSGNQPSGNQPSGNQPSGNQPSDNQPFDDEWPDFEWPKPPVNEAPGPPPTIPQAPSLNQPSFNFIEMSEEEKNQMELERETLRKALEAEMQKDMRTAVSKGKNFVEFLKEQYPENVKEYNEGKSKNVSSRVTPWENMYNKIQSENKPSLTLNQLIEQAYPSIQEEQKEPAEEQKEYEAPAEEQKEYEEKSNPVYPLVEDTPRKLIKEYIKTVPPENQALFLQKYGYELGMHDVFDAYHKLPQSKQNQALNNSSYNAEEKIEFAKQYDKWKAANVETPPLTPPKPVAPPSSAETFLTPPALQQYPTFSRENIATPFREKNLQQQSIELSNRLNSINVPPSPPSAFLSTMNYNHPNNVSLRAQIAMSQQWYKNNERLEQKYTVPRDSDPARFMRFNRYPVAVQSLLKSHFVATDNARSVKFSNAQVDILSKARPENLYDAVDYFMNQNYPIENNKPIPDAPANERSSMQPLEIEAPNVPQEEEEEVSNFGSGFDNPNIQSEYENVGPRFMIE